ETEWVGRMIAQARADQPARFPPSEEAGRDVRPRVAGGGGEAGVSLAAAGDLDHPGEPVPGRRGVVHEAHVPLGPTLGPAHTRGEPAVLEHTELNVSVLLCP